MATDLGAITGGSQPKGDLGKVLDQSMASLSHSQATVDKVRAEAAQAKAQADAAQSPLGQVKETATGALGSLAKGIVEPFARLGANVVNMGKQAIHPLTPQDPAAPVNIPLLGETKPVGQEGSFGRQVTDALVTGGEAATTVAGGEGVLNTLKKPVTKVASLLADRATKKAEERALQDSIEAVYNSPTGKKFVQTSSQVLKGQRALTPASVFREQGLTPDEQTVNLGTRLKDLKLGKDPVKNTQRLADEMQTTEEKLQTALEGNPEIKYLADKPTLYSKLNEIQTNAPNEFRIGDSPKIVKSVTDFARKIVDKTDDSIQGLRKARSEFDAQAMKQYPSAYKDGVIDTKTAAGNTIKTVRDALNQHMYDTAPNGSELQNLIGREADLFRAAKASFEKAASGEGKNALAQWAKENPTKVRILEAAGALTVGGTAVGILKSGN